jgi:hypothetical protein
MRFRMSDENGPDAEVEACLKSSEARG